MALEARHPVSIVGGDDPLRVLARGTLVELGPAIVRIRLDAASAAETTEAGASPIEPAEPGAPAANPTEPSATDGVAPASERPVPRQHVVVVVHRTKPEVLLGSIAAGERDPRILEVTRVARAD